MNPFEDSEITSIIVCNDIEASKTFYLNVLGAELFRSYGTSIVIKFLGSWFLLVTEGGPTADKPNNHFTPKDDPNKTNIAFTIRVKDCFSSYEILKDRGAKFITPPYDWGAEVRCFFTDPDHNLFEISEFKG